MGSSRFFDNDAESINVGDISILQNIFDGGGTVSAWTYLDSFVSNQRILSKNNSSGWIFYYRSASSSLSFFQVFSSGNIREDTSTALSTGVWRYVSVTYNANSSSNRPNLFIDGELVASTLNSALPVNPRASDVGADFVIGNTQGLTGAMRGELSHCQAWDRILSVGEIKESMYKPGSIRQNLIGYWPCMGDSPERDLSGNGNTGVVTGATVSFDGSPITKFL